MKTNAYTSIIQEIHAPAPAVERAIAYAKSKPAAPAVRYRRPLIAAAIVLLLLGVGVIYGIFLAPTAAVYLDSRESVTIILNSRGRVLSASGHPELDGKTAQEAVEAVTCDMLDSGAIDGEENTLILGTTKLLEDTQAQLTETVKDTFAESRFHGAIISLPCSERGAKAAVIDLLTATDDSLSENSLKHLGANDLNLLLHEYAPNGAVLDGEPSESGYIGKEAAIQRARENSKLTDAEISVTYTVYHDRLVYLVRIISDDRAEAFFINAGDGRIESALRTTPEKIEQVIKTEVKDSVPKVEKPTVQTADADIPQKLSAPTDTPVAFSESVQPATAQNTPGLAASAPTDPIQDTAPTVLPTESVSDILPTEIPTSSADQSKFSDALQKKLKTADPDEMIEVILEFVYPSETRPVIKQDYDENETELYHAENNRRILDDLQTQVDFEVILVTDYTPFACIRIKADDIYVLAQSEYVWGIDLNTEL